MKKIDAKRTALLLLDVQKDLVDITPGLKENRVIENMARVLAAARRRKANVIHITASVRPDFLDLPRDNPLWDGLRKKRQLIIGTKGAAIDRRVKVSASAGVIAHFVKPAGPAGTAGLQPDDWIKEIDGKEDRKSTRLNSSHIPLSRMPSSA